MNEAELEEKLVYKLASAGCYSKGHMCWDTWVRRGFPKDVGRDIEKVAKSLVKRKLVLTNPTHHDTQVRLNYSNKPSEIEAILERRKNRLDFGKVLPS